MQYLKTSNCVICGCKAEYWHGHVVAKERMALGNYGEYSTELMGKCIPLFST